MAKQDSMDALMDATVALMAERSPAALTVRDIATRAGVNHGLVHHYFGSKSKLVRAAAVRASRQLYEGQPAELRLDWTFRLLRDHPELVRILARLVLDTDEGVLSLIAPSAERLQGWWSALDERFEPLGVDPKVLNAFGAAALMGWFLFKPLLEQALDVPDGADAELEKLLVLLDGWLADRAPEA